jgi:RNA polymerase-binding transcription factor DksA
MALPTPFDPDLLERARATLVAEQARLRAELGEAIEGPGQMTYGSQASAASQVFAQQRDLAMREHARTQLEQVDEALARLDSDSFGICLYCGKPIHSERLEALPWAPQCIECARGAGR